MDKQTAAIYVR